VNICPGRLIGLAEKQWSADMAYNGEVLKALDDMTEPDKALWMVLPIWVEDSPEPSEMDTTTSYV
jgi:hypothetical protein